jgi:hypothetical protein
MSKLKIIALAVFFILAAFSFRDSKQFSVVAKSDVFEEIAVYKTWKQINRKDSEVKIDAFRVFDSAVGG